ncbi:MAG: hypothetical protein P8080_06215 [Gammaproteobacteria bacterium]
MNEIQGVVNAQMDALTELLENAREEYRKATLEEAGDQARSYVKKARRTARQRVSGAVAEERDRLDRQVRMAAAEAETEQRRRARMRDIELIRAGWDALEPALRNRWTSAEGRREWALAAVEEARSVLLSRSWELEHPKDWDEAEREALAEAARDRFDVELGFSARDDVKAGVRIRNGTTLVDMSLAGLLAHRRSVEGELLAEVRRDTKPESGDNDE